MPRAKKEGAQGKWLTWAVSQMLVLIKVILNTKGHRETLKVWFGTEYIDIPSYLGTVVAYLVANAQIIR